MIDINELRRLAQAATPGPWIGCGPSFGESLPKYLNEVVVDREGDEDDGYSICNTPIGLDEELSADMAFIAAANPAAINELLDRLEAAESDALEQARLNGMGASREAALMAKLEAAEKERDDANAAAAGIALQAETLQAERDTLRTELADLRSSMTFRTSLIGRIEAERDALRARIEAMERKEPVAWMSSRNGFICKDNKNTEYNMPLYLAPGAQPAPIEQDTSVRKAWSRFSNELHRSPDAPYPGMSEAFEQHFSQSFTDREWRAESSTWAAAWKAAKRHEAQAQPAPSALAEAIIADMQAQYNSELITENDSGEALIRLDGAIAAVEDNFALAQPAPLLASSDVSLMDEGKTEGTPSIPEGWRKELFFIQHAMAMNNWNWESDASNNTKRAAYAAVARLLATTPEAKP